MSTTTSRLTDEQIAEYRENGFIGVNDVFSMDEVEQLRRATDEFVAQSAELSDHTDVFDLDFAAGHSLETPKLRRIKEPHMRHPVYEAAMRKEGLLDIIEQLLGPNIKLHHTKLNMKAPGGGAQVEWHTDWGFYPATNDDILEIGLTFDDMEIENGCLMGIPGSHEWPALDHNQNGYFIGAVSQEDFDMEAAVPIRIKAGGVSIHHVRALHGSAPNISDRPRRLLLMGYQAADAWPLSGVSDWDAWTNDVLRGEPTNQPRLEPVPVRMPFPPHPKPSGSIFELQEQLEKSHFASELEEAGIQSQQQQQQ